jgi:putative ABC transport system permease protein
MKFFLLILRNVRRTALGTMALVLVVTLVWSILSFLSAATEEKKNNLKAIITERWQIPSQMPYSYAASLSEGAARDGDDVRPVDSMTWSFFGGSTESDPAKVNLMTNGLFAFAMEPSKLTTMMDDLDSLEGQAKVDFDATVRALEENRQGIILGKVRLAALDKRVGETITLHGINYKDITLELTIVGTFPEGRYDQSAVIHRDYLNNALDVYPETHGGQKHPLDGKSLNLVWIKVPDMDAFNQVADQINNSPLYTAPSVKAETASSGVASFLDAYRDLIWGMRWLMAPAAIVSLSLVISNAIGISVRERRLELAVLKVLGFRPAQILVLVLGESLLLGAGAGFLSSAGTYFVVNAMGGVKFPIAFFPAFFIPIDALWWGPVVGGLAALLGSIGPTWSACTVKVTDVFSKVA